MLSTTSLPSVHVTSPDADVVGISTFCSVLSVVVEFNGLEVVSSFVIGEDEALVDVLVCSVIGFLLDVTGVVGRLVVLRVMTVDLTVEVLIVGLAVLGDGFGLVVFSTDSTENVVTSISSADKVVGSTFTIKSVGVGFGRGAFVVST